MNENEIDIEITITKESNEEETNNYLKNVLKISEKTIEALGLDSEYLFEVTSKDVKEFLNNKQAQQEECEMLEKFIKKRNEKINNESIKITKNSTKDDIVKFIKEKLNFDIDKQNIDELNFDNNAFITNEEKEILNYFINEKKIFYNKDNNEDNQGEIDKLNSSIKRNSTIRYSESSEIEYSKKEKTFFRNESNYNIFFIIGLENESLSNLEFATFLNNSSSLSLYSSYINYDSYLLNISTYYLDKNKKYFLFLFQVVLDKPIQKLSINIRNKEYDNDILFETEQTIKNEDDDVFILEPLESESTYYYVANINNNNIFTY